MEPAHPPPPEPALTEPSTPQAIEPSTPQTPESATPQEVAGSLDEIFAGIEPESPLEGSRILAEEEEELFGSEQEKHDFVRDLEFEQKLVDLSGLRQDIDERQKYASRLFVLLACWMGFVAICFLLTGLKDFRFSFMSIPVATGGFFYLSDTVLIALLAGATVNLIALFAIVAWYLFPKK